MNALNYKVVGSTAWLTLDAPERRNAITAELLEQFAAAMNSANTDHGVRAIVLGHTGSTFCAGADLSGAKMSGAEPSGAKLSGAEMRRPAAEELNPRERQMYLSKMASSAFRSLIESPKPVIGAIDGHVRAGGMGFAAGCDFVVAGPRATFGLSEVRIGLVAAMIAPPVLARLGDRNAADWMLRGRTVSASEAAAAGFVTQAVDGIKTTVEQAVDAILADLRLSAPAALAASKKLLNARVLRRWDREANDMIELSAHFFTSPDAAAGMRAFREKSAAPWVLDA